MYLGQNTNYETSQHYPRAGKLSYINKAITFLGKHLISLRLNTCNIIRSGIYFVNRQTNTADNVILVLFYVCRATPINVYIRLVMSLMIGLSCQTITRETKTKKNNGHLTIKAHTNIC